MLEHALSSHYQKLLIDPLLHHLGKRITPTHLTCLSGLFGLLFLPFLLWQHPYWAISSLLISGYLDTLDGSLARFQNTTSDFGSALDIMVDRVVEVAVVLSLYMAYPIQHALASLLMLGSMLLCITSFLVVGIFTNNASHKSFYYSPGLMERAEAFFFFIVIALWPNFFNPLAGIFCVLVCSTAIIRIREFKQAQEMGCTQG